MARKKKQIFDANKEIRAIARERVGIVKPGKAIEPKERRKPKYKQSLEESV